MNPPPDPATRRFRGLAVWTAAFGLAAAAAAVGCSKPQDPVERSLILVTLDTFRADRLGAYGGTVVATPHLDRAAREGTVFEDAFAVAPLTLPSHATLLTGRFPASHGARHNGFYRLRGSELTLAEALQAQGFDTAAFVGSYVLNRGFGLEQGFELYDDIPDPGIRQAADPLNDAQRTADAVNERVFAWLAKPPEGRFFLWVHYYDPHHPYDPPERPGRVLEGRGYDREISYVDACFGDLMERLDAAGVLERSILAVVGDHGESLGEHREQTHGVFLYDGSLHVPLFVRAPGRVPAGRRVHGPVSGVDLAPTLLDLLGLAPLPDAQGRSLVPEIDGAGAADETVYAETLMPHIEFGWSALRMARDGRYKYVEAPREELYDLVADPGELDNLAEIKVERTRRMAEEVRAWVERTSEEDSGEARRDLSPEELERLRSLGYLGGEAVGQGDAATTGADPKDALDTHLRIEEAKRNIAAGDDEAGVSVLENVLADSPDNPLAVALLLKTLVETGRLDEAEQVARDSLDAAVASPTASSTFLRQTRLRLAAIYHMQGREDEAEATYRAALEGWVPDDSRTTLSLPGLTTAVGPEIAVRVFEGLLEAEPDHPVALAGRLELALAADDGDTAARTAQRILATGAAHYVPEPVLVDAARLMLDRGEPEAAAELFRTAVERMGPQADLMGYLGTALLSAGRLDEAETALEQARRLRPADPRAPFYLGNIALLRQQEARAREMYDEALRLDPDWTEPLHNLALWLMARDRPEEAVEVLREALERDPADERARELLDKLGQPPRVSS